MRRDELRELMKAIAYPEGWFYVERAAVIMFGLSSQLAPKLNTVQVGMPYVMKFMMARTAERNAAAAAAVTAAAAPVAVKNP
jgi:ubiquinone biosynthesis protein